MRKVKTAVELDAIKVALSLLHYSTFT